MTTIFRTYESSRRRFLIFSGLFLAATFLILVLFAPSLHRHYLLVTANTQASSLRLAVDGLRLTLDHYSRIPALIAARPEIEAYLDNLDSEQLKIGAENLLSETASALGAEGVYLENAEGELLASNIDNSNLPTESSNFYRPYFEQVVAGGIGQYYALGTQSGDRGYFYAAPVRDGVRIKGVVAVRFSVDKFEANLRDSDAEIIVRDSNDIIFISSRNDWNFKTLIPLSDNKRQIIDDAKQFPSSLISHLPNTFETLDGNISFYEIEETTGMQHYVASTSLLARAGWRVTILSPAKDAYISTGSTMGAILVTAALLSAIALLIWQHQARLSERLTEQRLAKQSLEMRVAERTDELNLSNQKLVLEIEERRAAETQLRQTQNELIQAGKLAALGQMSAAISHEFNQPLAATKAYAENTHKFIDRSRLDDAQNNVSQIVSMVDRMSSIAKHLRNFARRPQEKTIPVRVASAIDAVMELMRAQISKQGTDIDYVPPDEDLWVIGGNVRLQQVLLNLIKNGLDATENQPNSSIKILTKASKKKVRIMVFDNGSGIEETVLSEVFDPFFSTKNPGQGMGLGLSISYNIVKDFGGELVAKNIKEGGACFEIILNRTMSPEMEEAMS